MVKAIEKSTGTGLSFERKWDGDIERLKRSVDIARSVQYRRNFFLPIPQFLDLSTPKSYH
jgi:hypothetical protein